MGVIYRPWTGNINEDMKHVRIFDSFESMREQIAREHGIDIEAISDGGYANQETEDIKSGFISSNYLSECSLNPKFKPYNMQYPINFGLFSLKWNEDLVKIWAHIREGIIYRPPCGNLDDAMSKIMYFNNFEDLQYWIAVEYKNNHYIKLKPEEVVASGQSIYDDRIGWLNSDYLCIDSYEKIEDKEGYEKFFGGRYDSPQCIGYFATKWNRDQPNGILKSPGVWIN